MNVQVVTVFAKRDPRPECPPWQEYLPMLRLQRDSARWFGHGHMVVTDADLGEEFQTLRTNLPAELMPAMVSGVVARLKAAQYGTTSMHIVFVDADCLIAKNLDDAFDVNWELGLTYRAHPTAPINNGAMYVHRDGIYPAMRFFEDAQARCGTHWGADQEAISQAAMPIVSEIGAVGLRHGCRVGFLNMKRYAAVPKSHLSKHGAETFIVHFKGDTKRWMADYANEFIFKDESRGAG